MLTKTLVLAYMASFAAARGVVRRDDTAVGSSASVNGGDHHHTSWPTEHPTHHPTGTHSEHPTHSHHTSPTHSGHPTHSPTHSSHHTYSRPTHSHHSHSKPPVETITTTFTTTTCPGKSNTRLSLSYSLANSQKWNPRPSRLAPTPTPRLTPGRTLSPAPRLLLPARAAAPVLLCHRRPLQLTPPTLSRQLLLRLPSTLQLPALVSKSLILRYFLTNGQQWKPQP